MIKQKHITDDSVEETSMYTMTNDDDEPDSHNFQESSCQQHLEQTIYLNDALRSKDKSEVAKIDETSWCKLVKVSEKDAKFKEISKPNYLSMV